MIGNKLGNIAKGIVGTKKTPDSIMANLAPKKVSMTDRMNNLIAPQGVGKGVAKAAIKLPAIKK